MKQLIKFEQILTKLTYITLIFYLISCQTISLKNSLGDEEIESSLQVVYAFLDKGQPDRALIELTSLRKKLPKHPDVQNLTGLAHLALHNEERALSYFIQAYKNVPKIPYGLNISAALIALKRWEEAEKTLKKLLPQLKSKEPYPHPERIYQNLGFVSEQRGNLKGAGDYYRRAIAESPTFYLPRISLAQLLMKMNRPEEALTQFKSAHTMCPTCPQPVIILVKSYLRKGDITKAQLLVTEFQKTEGVLPADVVMVQGVYASAMGRQEKKTF